MIRFGQDVCGSLDAALRREWLETNGLDGFASSTNPFVLRFDLHLGFDAAVIASTEPRESRRVTHKHWEEVIAVDQGNLDSGSRATVASKRMAVWRPANPASQNKDPSFLVRIHRVTICI